MKLTTDRPSQRDAAKNRIIENLSGSGQAKRLNVQFDADFYQRMKMRAAEENRTISSITQQLWREYLSK